MRLLALFIVCLGLLMACEEKPKYEINETQYPFNTDNESTLKQTNPYNDSNRSDSSINTNRQGSYKNEYANDFNTIEPPKPIITNTPVNMYDNNGNWYWGSSTKVGNSNSSSISMYDSKGNWYWGSSNQIGNSNLSSVSMYDSKGNWYWGSSTKIGNTNTMNLNNGSMNNSFGTQNNFSNTGNQNQFGF